MITNEQLTEIFKPLFDAAKEKGLKINGVSFYPSHDEKFSIMHGVDFDIVCAVDLSGLVAKVLAMPGPETDEERIRRELLHHENKANELRAQLEAAQ